MNKDTLSLVVLRSLLETPAIEHVKWGVTHLSTNCIDNAFHSEVQIKFDNVQINTPFNAVSAIFHLHKCCMLFANHINGPQV